MLAEIASSISDCISDDCDGSISDSGGDSVSLFISATIFNKDSSGIRYSKSLSFSFSLS